MSGKNLHSAVTAELIRRGGNKKRPARVSPENIDGVVDQLRETNQRAHGAQPLVATKALWQKTAGANAGMNTLDGKPHRPNWESTRRQLNWKDAGRQKTHVEDDEREGSVEGASHCSTSTAQETARMPDSPRVSERRAEHVRLLGNAAAPGHPDDLHRCDLTALEDKLLGVIYATDEWVEPEWSENVPPRDNSQLTEPQKG